MHAPRASLPGPPIHARWPWTRLPVECAVRVPVEKKIVSESSEEENLICCLEVRTAGDPDEEEIVFTDLSPRILAERLDEMGTPVGRDAIATGCDPLRTVKNRRI